MSFWRIDVTALTPYKRGKRSIKGGPLIDLGRLQVLLRSGTFDLDNLWVANIDCEDDLRKWRWTYADVLQMLVSLDGRMDYKKSEWCEISNGSMVACDVYAMVYDHERQQRNKRQPADAVRTYLKFSLDETGMLTIVLASCHL